MDKVERFREIANDLAELYAKKNADYGDSFGRTFKELGPISALTRISDKFNRAKNIIIHSKGDINFESLEDTFLDMAAYCIMTTIEVENSRKENNE